ncbi:MAG TPA: SDR family oxidoreductase [Dermatophilaceae bacterium]|nr:SDR family oxidoreductase [Dermatophilaceae bacterium]
MTLFAPGLLDGRIAVVTGGGSGIGRATALELASLGCQVAVLGRRAETLDETVARAEGAGRVSSYPVDVREPEQVETVLDRIGADLGAVDTLVNNAGGQFVSPAEGISLNGFRAVTRLNLDAVWNLTTSVANRWMVAAGYGKVVSVVISPRRAMPGMAHSAAARAGVENMTRTMAVEWGRYGIRLNCVAPGIIHTEAWERYGLAPEAVAAAIPAGTLGTAEDVAHAITYLVSSAGDYVTGATLLVDGGLDNTGPGAAWSRSD